MMKKCAFQIDLQHKNGIPSRRCFSSPLVIKNELFTSQADDMQHNATLGKDVLATACLMLHFVCLFSSVLSRDFLSGRGFRSRFTCNSYGFWRPLGSFHGLIGGVSPALLRFFATALVKCSQCLVR